MTRETGVVTFWDPRGYGYIKRDCNAADAKFLIAQWRPQQVSARGQKVSFVVAPANDPSAKPRANDVQLDSIAANNALAPPIPEPTAARPGGGEKSGSIVNVGNNNFKIADGQARFDFDVNQLCAGALHPLTSNDLKNVRVQFNIDPGNPNQAIKIKAMNQLPRIGDFLHPYYFIPPATGVSATAQGHDRLKTDAYFGKLRVKITAVTPLLLPDAAQKTSNSDKHTTVATRIDRDGKPLIASTSVKGMLRSAFELITDSRFGVFGKHESRLGYRQDAKEALAIWPARISNVVLSSDGKPASFNVTIFDGDATAQSTRWDTNKFQPAAWVPTHRNPIAITVEHEGLADAVLVNDEKQKSGRTIRFKRTTALTSFSDPAPTQTERGYFSKTNRSFGKKHDERFFYKPRAPLTYTGDAAIALAKKWRELITNFRDQHTGNDFAGPAPGEAEWSIHQQGERYSELRDGLLCYARLNVSGQVEFLSPVQIGRELYEKSPAALLPDHQKPATSHAEFSPAERLFGYASQAGSNADGTTNAYRGHLRFGPVDCMTGLAAAITKLPEFGESGLPLAILAEPKPAQSRFYLREGMETLAGKGKSQTYLAEQQLAGRKVYPHQLHGADYWLQPKPSSNTGTAAQSREYVRAAEPTKLRNSQNRSLKDWVPVDTKFAFDLRLSNVYADDLAALLWLLSLPTAHYYKLGGGKPYGFGSVRIDVDWAQSSLRTGAVEIARYQEFPTLATAPGALVQARLPQFEPTEPANAFLRAAKGLATTNNTPPTHYPRRTSHPAQNDHDKFAPIYDWFGVNDKGPKAALPLLKSDANPVVLNYTPITPVTNNGDGNGAINNGGNGGNHAVPAPAYAAAMSAALWPAWVTDPMLRSKRMVSAEQCWVSDDLYRFWDKQPAIRKKELFDTLIASTLKMITGDYAKQAGKVLARYTATIEKAGNP